MTANECITGRRSIRKFTEQPVAHELIEKIVAAAAYAPSWKNTQITRYIAVEGEKKAALAKCTNLYAGNGVIMEQAPMVIAVTMIEPGTQAQGPRHWQRQRQNGRPRP